jgi:hypothetical protein
VQLPQALQVGAVGAREHAACAREALRADAQAADVSQQVGTPFERVWACAGMCGHVWACVGVCRHVLCRHVWACVSMCGRV